jgi:UDP-N-acetylmuramoyl-tripeptide--D-alanyl-D-alanine ligase
VIRTSLAELAAAVGGTLDRAGADVVVDGAVTLDSRRVEPGGLFGAVAGERVDGHAYARDAVAAGAAAALLARPVGVPAVLVDDTVAALGRLARSVLARLPALVVVAVTGSSGKTSTKDLLAQLLVAAGPTVAAEGSYNNELGLPLTALKADPATRNLVLEMGARGPGHIAALCAVAPPRVGVVLNVGSAHLGEFGSREAIARAKAELVEALAPDGLAVLNADDAAVAAMAARTAARVVTFGESRRADVRADAVRLDGAGRPSFTLLTPEGSAAVGLRLHGGHQVANALAAACVGRELGLSPSAVAAGLAAAVPLSRWRMEVVERPDGVTVVNDAYNANPDSVRAALKALVAMAGGRRTWAVLGEMRELGPESVVEHDAIGRLAVRLDVARLVVVGPGARPIHTGAFLEGSWGGESVYVPDADAAARLLREQVRPPDIVLVKASRAAGLERVATGLLDPDPAAGAGA